MYWDYRGIWKEEIARQASGSSWVLCNSLQINERFLFPTNVLVKEVIDHTELNV